MQQQQQEHSQTTNQHAEGFGIGFGTPLYAAPEQLNGICNKKSDIYSMGVILIEILSRCETEMEKFNVVDQIHGGKVPENFDPDFCGLIRK